MEIYVETRSKARKEDLQVLTRLFMHKLNLARSRYRLTVILESGMIEQVDARGTVLQVGERDLLMVLDRRLKPIQLVQTVAHEMIHVKQFCRGQLSQHVDRKGELYFKWMGRRYNKDYYDRPWELDAFRNERILANHVFRLAD